MLKCLPNDIAGDFQKKCLATSQFFILVSIFFLLLILKYSSKLFVLTSPKFYPSFKSTPRVPPSHPLRHILYKKLLSIHFWRRRVRGRGFYRTQPKVWTPNCTHNQSHTVSLCFLKGTFFINSYDEISILPRFR